MHNNNLKELSHNGDFEGLQSLLICKKFDSQVLAHAINICIENDYLTSNHLESVKLLLSFGADLSFKDSRGLTLLMIACFKGNLELVKIILNYQTDVNQVDKNRRSCVCISLLNDKDPVSIIQALYLAGVDIHMIDCAGAVALHYAVNKGHELSCLYLISKGASATICDAFLDSPLHIAFRKDKIDMVKILLPLSDLIQKNKYGKTPLDEAHGRSLAYHTSLAFNADVFGTSSQKFGYNHEIISNECFKCKSKAEVFCLNCVEELNMQKIQISERGKVHEFENLISKYEQEIKLLKEHISKLEESIKLSKMGNLPMIHLKHFRKPEEAEIIPILTTSMNNFLTEHSIFILSVEEIYKQVITLITECIESNVEGTKVEQYGSYAQGLYLPHSDIDLVINQLKCKPAVAVLDKVVPPLESLGIVQNLKKIYAAKFPIIKFSVYPSPLIEIKIDISVNEGEHRGKDCVFLVKALISKYPELKSTFLTMKHLVYLINFNEPFKGGVGSYTLFLMIVASYQKKLNPHIKKPEGQIFLEFLKYFTEEYDYNLPIIVECEALNIKDYKNSYISSSYSNDHMNIPDPLNPTRNVAHLTDSYKLSVTYT